MTVDELQELYDQTGGTLADLRRLQSEVEADEFEPLRPGLAGRADEALKLLLAPLDDLVRDLAHAAREATGLSQAVAPPAKGEEALALRHLGLPLEAAGRQLSLDLATTWDTHLQRWLRRHHGVVDRLTADLGATGRGVALTELALTEAEPILQTSNEWARLPARFEGVGETLGAELRVGTPRSLGLAGILDGTRTLGATALHLRRLHDAARPVLERLADQVTWTAYAEGYRLAAIDGTHALLQAADAMPPAGLALTTATLSDVVRAALPRYRWSGPQDEETCGPCSARRRQTVYALSVDEMPCCRTVCAHLAACRHHWTKV